MVKPFRNYVTFKFIKFGEKEKKNDVRNYTGPDLDLLYPQEAIHSFFSSRRMNPLPNNIDAPKKKASWKLLNIVGKGENAGRQLFFSYHYGCYPMKDKLNVLSNICITNAFNLDKGKILLYMVRINVSLLNRL